jgi:molybdopterin-guanine dinucleotide biosynthesis protein A
VGDSSKRIIAAIIAGGASSRFGGIPKGLETVGGRRILDRVADAARAITADVILVSNSEDGHGWLPGVRVARDMRPERGSLVGIHTALTASRGPVLVLAWDMPFVSSELLALIVRRGDDEPFAAIPEGPWGLEPFCALYKQACLPIVEQAIDAGDLRVTNLPLRFPFFLRIPSSEVRALGDPAQLFFNVNSAADLATAEEIEGAHRSRHR